MAEGYKIRLNPLGEAIQIWIIAVSDRQAALDGVRVAAGVSAKTEATVIEELTAAELGHLGLAPGLARAVK
jgi:hypothetical protein